jgi:hypothetical protein
MGNDCLGKAKDGPYASPITGLAAVVHKCGDRWLYHLCVGLDYGHAELDSFRHVVHGTSDPAHWVAGFGPYNFRRGEYGTLGKGTLLIHLGLWIIWVASSTHPSSPVNAPCREPSILLHKLHLSRSQPRGERAGHGVPQGRRVRRFRRPHGGLKSSHSPMRVLAYCLMPNRFHSIWRSGRARTAT